MFGKIIDNFLFSDDKGSGGGFGFFKSNEGETDRSIKSYLDYGYVYFTVPNEEFEDVVETLHHNNIEPVDSKAETILSHDMDNFGDCSQLLFYENLESLKTAVGIIWEQDKSKVFAVYNGDWILNKDPDIETFIDRNEAAKAQ